VNFLYRFLKPEYIFLLDFSAEKVKSARREQLGGKDSNLLSN
jgi:hypothetical protein